MELTAQNLLAAYGMGVFPMARARDDDGVDWFLPDMRGIIPLDNFHIPQSLAKLRRKNPFTVTINRNFSATIRLCAETRADTWISPYIEAAYTELHRLGFAHSVECWDGNNVLVGGLYGVAIGGAFFGESMASRQSGASKIALTYLVERLIKRGFTVLDCQYINPHLRQFGCVEIPNDVYQSKLSVAVSAPVSFVDGSGSLVLSVAAGSSTTGFASGSTQPNNHKS